MDGKAEFFAGRVSLNEQDSMADVVQTSERSVKHHRFGYVWDCWQVRFIYNGLTFALP